MTVDPDARNTCQIDRRLDPYAFRLKLGQRVELLAEQHNGDYTTLTLRRKPAHLLALEEQA